VNTAVLRLAGRTALVTGAVTFLACDTAGWITAQNIRVNGGTV
jgi:hypothetical protein